MSLSPTTGKKDRRVPDVVFEFLDMPAALLIRQKQMLGFLRSYSSQLELHRYYVASQTSALATCSSRRRSTLDIILKNRSSTRRPPHQAKLVFSYRYLKIERPTATEATELDTLPQPKSVRTDLGILQLVERHRMASAAFRAALLFNLQASTIASVSLHYVYQCTNKLHSNMQIQRTNLFKNLRASMLLQGGSSYQ